MASLEKLEFQAFKEQIETMYQVMLEYLQQNLDIKQCSDLLDQSSKVIKENTKAGLKLFEQALANAGVNINQLTEESRQELIEQYKKIKDVLQEDIEGIIARNYGVQPQEIVIRENDKQEIVVKGIHHKEFKNILYNIKADIPLMLVGESGAGKSYTCREAAKALGLDFYISNAVTQEFALTGFIDARGEYHTTQFHEAFTKGGLFVIDELDASSVEVILVLHNAIANKEYPFPYSEKPVKAHKDFRVVATANSYGFGESYIYVGRNQLDGATIDRFTVINFGYDPRIERSLVHDQDIYEFVVHLRRAVNRLQMRHLITMRASIYLSKLSQAGQEEEECIKECITKGIPKDDLTAIATEMSKNGGALKGNIWYKSFLAVVEDKTKNS